MILKEVLIQYEIQNNKNHQEVAKEIGVSLSTYYRWINGESTKLKKKTIDKLSKVLDCDVEKVIEESECIKPVMGRVKAGYDLWADEDIEGYVELGKNDARMGDYFLRVTGDSMEGVHIYEGDLVYVQSTPMVSNGSIAVVMVEEEVTIKKVYFKNEFMILEAANPKYESRFFTPQEIEELPVKIIGLVRFVRRDFV